MAHPDQHGEGTLPTVPTVVSLSAEMNLKAHETGSDRKIECNNSRSAHLHKYKLRQNLQFAALCWSLFLAGWNDGTTGPLLPRIQREYHVRYTENIGPCTYSWLPLVPKVGFGVVSLIWVFACIVRCHRTAADARLVDHSHQRGI
jgi:hypothetical protein